MEFYRHYTMPVIPGFSNQEGQMPQYLLASILKHLAMETLTHFGNGFVTKSVHMPVIKKLKKTYGAAVGTEVISATL